MLKNTNDDLLCQKGLDPKYVFFYQLWKELTHNKTLDSYQFRVKNTLNSIEELANLLQHSINGTIKNNNAIKNCKDEAISIIRNDKVLAKYHSAIQKSLLSKLAPNIGDDYQKRMMLHSLQYSQPIISEQYNDHLMELLEEAIENDEKDSILVLTNQLVSTCVSQGWSEFALHKKVDILKCSKKNRWNIFKSSLSFVRQETYLVFFPINLVGDKKTITNEIATFNIPIIDSNKLITDYGITGCSIKQGDYIALKVNAFDYYSASNKAISVYDDVINIISFYGLIPSKEKNYLSWIVYNERNKQSKRIYINDIRGTYNYMEGVNVAYKNAKSISQTIGTDEELVKNRLFAAYNYAIVGRNSYSLEQKLLNNWIALEALCRTSDFEYIIENIIEVVPPALCTRYLYKLMRNFIEDCTRCEVDLVCIGINRREPIENQVTEMIAAVNDNSKIQILSNECRINSLLSRRLDEIKALYSDKNRMAEKVKTHNKNLAMQLNRLYRLRNQITHSAYRSTEPLIKYCEHLEDYLNLFIIETVRLSSDMNEQNALSVYEAFMDNYCVFDSATQNKKSKISIPLEKLLDNFYKTGMIQMIYKE